MVHNFIILLEIDSVLLYQCRYACCGAKMIESIEGNGFRSVELGRRAATV